MKSTSLFIFAATLSLVFLSRVSLSEAQNQEPRGLLSSQEGAQAPAPPKAERRVENQADPKIQGAALRGEESGGASKTTSDRERQKRKAARDVALMMLGISQSSSHRD